MRVRSTIMVLAVLAMGCGTKNVETPRVTLRQSSDPVKTMKRDHDSGVSTHPSTDLKRTWNLALWDQARWWDAVKNAEAVNSQVRAASNPSPGASAAVSATNSVNGYPCGGDLPSCCTLQKESGGTPTAQNPVSSSSGLWQDTDSTWDNYKGYAHAKDAPPDIQNERNRQIWNNGAGWANWKGDGCYPGG